MDKFYEEKIISEKLLKERILFIDKEINDKTASSIVAKLLYLDAESHDDITIYINSPGGQISSGFMIYDTIQLIRSDVQTVSLGISASMAAILLLSGAKGKRKILPNSRVMLHDLSGRAIGKYNDIMVEVEEMQKIHDKLFMIIKENTKLTDDEINENLKNDFWLNSEEALKYGIIDEIVLSKKV